ncbi:hypothetical protein D3C76_1314560 [compost metagenome]
MVLVLGQDGAQRVLLVIEPGEVNRRGAPGRILELFSDVGLHPSDVLGLQPLIIRSDLADRIKRLVVLLESIRALLGVGPCGLLQSVDLADGHDSRLLPLAIQFPGLGNRLLRVSLLNESLELKVGIRQLLLRCGVVRIAVHRALRRSHALLRLYDATRDILVPANVLDRIYGCSNLATQGFPAALPDR